MKKKGLSEYHNQSDDVKKLNELITDSEVAMLTTTDLDGTLRSRPMVTLERKIDGELWFYTHRSSHKAKEIEKFHHVNVTFQQPEDSAFVSLSGDAEIVDDPKRREEFWKADLRSYFPLGLEDPDLALLRVRVATAEYWEGPSTWMKKLIHFANVASSNLPFLVAGNGTVIVDPTRPKEMSSPH